MDVRAEAGNGLLPGVVMRRRWDTAPAHEEGETRWRNPPGCGYCRKRAYATRRAARQALSALYPGQCGAGMNVYRCAFGGPGWHLGHRRPGSVDPEWPTWTDAVEDVGCSGCTQTVRVGEPVAWVRHEPHCFDCGDLAERQALAS